MVRTTSIALALAATMSTSLARAQEVTTLELGAWPDTVAALESDVRAEGTQLSVCVREDHACVPCDRYTIALDEAGSRAFGIGTCNARTGTTIVTLVDRSALFDHTHDVPRPRAIELRASVMHEVVSRGAAAEAGGSALGCTAEVRPFLRDLEHGSVVTLGSDRYELRPRHAAVSVSAHDESWVLSTEEHVAAEIEYDVIERSTGETVLSGRTALECSDVAGAGGLAPRSRLHRPVPTPRSPWAAEGELVVRSDGPARILVDGDERGRTPLSLDLSAGPHEIRAIAADGTEQQRLVPVMRDRRTTVDCFFERDSIARVPARESSTDAIARAIFDPWSDATRVLDDEPVGPAPRCNGRHLLYVDRRGHGEGSCNGTAPDDDSFQFDVSARTALRARLVNEFGGAIVLRRVGGSDDIVVEGTTADLHGTASIDLVLAPGRYAISVETPEHEAGRYRFAWSLGSARRGHT
jgi:hypothetical protein